MGSSTTGRIAQLVRASRLHRECREFESLITHHPFRSARAQEECNRTLHVSHWKADGISPENQERPPVFARYLRMEVLKTVRKRFER